jgi:hypothetical protein
MARVRVGDIVIDGAEVRIGEPTARGAPPLGRPPDPFSKFLTQIDSRLLGYGGGLLLVGGGVALSLFWPGADPIGFLMKGGAFVLVGIGLLGIALLQPRLRRSMRLEEHKQYVAAIEAIRPLLRGAEPHQTVEWLVGRTGLSERQIVGALLALRETEGIIEELDEQTGQFYYGFPLLVGGASIESLDSRAERLKGDDF